jgi:hypothetical protein
MNRTPLQPDLPGIAPPGGYILWHRPAGRRGPWQRVGEAQTETEAYALVGTGGRKGGDWCVLPSGKDPNAGH